MLLAVVLFNLVRIDATQAKVLCPTAIAQVRTIQKGVTDLFVLRWFELTRNDMRTRTPLKAGDFLPLGRHTYQIIEPLGKGGEGDVYLISTSAGLRVAKVFNTRWGMIRNLVNSKLSGPSSSALRMPEIIYKDYGRATVLYEYIEGIPVSDILRLSNALGIPPDLVSRIARSTPPQYLDSNLIYSFQDSAFYLIDIH